MSRYRFKWVKITYICAIKIKIYANFAHFSYKLYVFEEQTKRLKTDIRITIALTSIRKGEINLDFSNKNQRKLR